jgi:hypothetical protein
MRRKTLIERRDQYLRVHAHLWAVIDAAESADENMEARRLKAREARLRAAYRRMVPIDADGVVRRSL